VPVTALDFLLSQPDWGSTSWMNKFTHSLSQVCHHQL
jgi:hypothetical protein